MTHRVVVHGIPRTKKTSNQGVVVPGRAGGKPRAVMFPAKEWREWVRDAQITVDGCAFVSVKKSLPRIVYPDPTGDPTLWTPLAVPMNCAAVFYLGNRQHGDTLGYLQGLADLLEQRQVIANDRWLASWDRSRLVHDGSTPRVEITLEPAPLTLD